MTVNAAEWTAAARDGRPVGYCPANHGKCGGELHPPRDVNGNTYPFHDHTDRDGHSTRFFEAICATCGASFAYPAGRTAAESNRRHAQQRDQAREAQAERDARRTGEFVPRGHA